MAENDDIRPQLSQAKDRISKLRLRHNQYNWMLHTNYKFQSYQLRNGQVILFVDCEICDKKILLTRDIYVTHLTQNLD